MFNRKSTESAQDIHKLKLALEEMRSQMDRLGGLIRGCQLEIADYHEKTRRLYLRINRREKVDEEEPETPSHTPSDMATTAGREEILRRFKSGQA